MCGHISKIKYENMLHNLPSWWPCYCDLTTIRCSYTYYSSELRHLQCSNTCTKLGCLKSERFNQRIV